MLQKQLKISIIAMAECLPQEVLSKIFSYLSLSDQLQSNLVCRQWRWSFLNPQIHSRSQIIFDDDDGLIQNLEDKHGGGLLESNLTSGVKSICLKNVTVSLFSLRPVRDWSSLLSKLTSLALVNASVVTEAEFVLLLKCCKSLTALTVCNARDIFISGGLLASKEEQNDVMSSLQNLTCLDLSNNSPYLTDQLFNRIVGCTTNISALTLVDTKILSHSGIYKKHYPDNVKDFDSPSVLTLRNVIRFLSERSSTVNSINFYNSNISAIGFQDIGRLNELKLKSVNVGKCSDISQEALLDFCRHQPLLESLNIDYCRKILVDNPATCLSLFETMSAKLREFSMVGLSAPRGIPSCFEQLDHLRALNISECDIPSSHVVQGLIANKGVRNSLQVLRMNSFGISSPDSMLTLAPDLISLTRLELKNCHEGLNDSVLQSISLHCTSLRVLIINNCSRLTDSGFMMTMDQNAPAAERQSSEDGKIFLGSKAEAELREDIRRHEYISTCLSLNDSPGFRRLKNLVHLEVQNVRITELTLIHAFVFDDLRLINLSLCKSVGDEGFQHLADNNPHLEQFIAKQCNITGKTLSQLVEKCKRLKVLDVEGCQDITNDSIEVLAHACPNLKHVDVSFCKKVKTATIERLMKSANLKTIGMRGLAIFEMLQESDDEDAGNKSPPRPPPFLTHRH